MSPQPEFTCPTPEELAQLILGYKVTELVSSGTRGALYQAKQLSLDRTVTIKVLPPEIGEDSTLRHAFETEAKAMARLNDPNLVDVFDFGNIQGMLYIIMEHVPGRSLHETTHGHHVDQKESARLVADLCLGLEHAHQAGIIHRALNPHKVLINNEAQAKIVDFGIASLTGIDSGDEVSRYSAPEVFQQGGHVDAKTDVYSAGMILYELIVGNLPSNPYTPPSQARNCRPEFDQIIYRAIQPDPAKRYGSAGEMAQAIEDVLDKMGAAPTQEVIKTMLTAATPATATRLPAASLNVAKPSNNSALIVTLLTMAVIVGIVFVVVKSSSEPTKEKTPTAQKPKAKPKKPNAPRKPKPDKPNHRKNRDRDMGNNQPKKPEPPVVIPPEPEPEEETEAVNIPLIDPEPAPPVKPEPPEFDIDAWLLKARAYMQNKDKYVIADYDKALLANINGFERDVKRITRKLDRNARKSAQIACDEVFAKFRLIGRLPEETDKETPKPINDLYKEALDDQKKIENKFLTKFTELRITYIQGIDKQIGILKKEANDDHAESLEEEISLTQKDMPRFIRILRGQEPDPEPDSEPEDKKEDAEKGKDKKKEGNKDENE